MHAIRKIDVKNHDIYPVVKNEQHSKWIFFRWKMINPHMHRVNWLLYGKYLKTKCDYCDASYGY